MRTFLVTTVHLIRLDIILTCHTLFCGVCNSTQYSSRNDLWKCKKISFHWCVSLDMLISFLALHAHCLDYLHTFTKYFYICCQSHQCEQITISSISNQTSKSKKEKEREREREKKELFVSLKRSFVCRRWRERSVDNVTKRKPSDYRQRTKVCLKEKRRRKRKREKREKVVYSCSSFS